MRRNKGFTLIELMIVVAIIAIIAAIAIPSLLGAKKSANEASAISSLRTICTTCEQYRNRHGSYPNALANLGPAGDGLIDGVLANGAKSGYTFGFNSNPANDTWSCTADPTTPGTTGDRYFFVDQSGVIRWNGAAQAGAGDPALE